MTTEEIRTKFPIICKTADYLQNKTIFFKSSIPKLLDTDYDFEFGERICQMALKISSNNWELYFKRVDKLVDLSFEFLKLQVQLEKTGKYLYSSFKEVEENLYSKNDGHEHGPDYLWGLYFSEIFWKIHYNFTKFFLQDFVKNVKNKGKVLEIPTGTGFFLCEFLRENSKWEGTGVDLADSSISISEEILKTNKINQESYELKKIDFHNLREEEKFDRIICGEFLEHLENPLEALKKFNILLKNDGKLFLTVAVWAAQFDHIYLYTNANDVRDHIKKAGFKIEKELVQAVFEKDEKDPEKSKIPVSYAAILSK